MEALPYIKEFSGETVVIKYGGAAMVDEHIKYAVMQDIALMKLIGMRPVIVHGGGPELSLIHIFLDIIPVYQLLCILLQSGQGYQNPTFDF